MDWYETYVRAREAFRLAPTAENGANLTEASLSRVWQHHQNAPHKSFAILTAWRQSDRSPAANKQAMASLHHDLRSAGLGYNQLTGYGQEVHGGEVTVAKEPSVFVHGVAREHAMKLGKKYQQDFVVYAGPETSGRVHLVNTSTGTSDDLGDFHPRKTGEYWSQLKNKRAFTIGHTHTPQTEAVVFEYTPQTIAESRKLSLVTEALFPDRRSAELV